MKEKNSSKAYLELKILKLKRPHVPVVEHLCMKIVKHRPDCGESVSKSLEVNSPTTGGTNMEKYCNNRGVMTKEIVQKMIKEETGELQKTVTTLTEENESLKKDWIILMKKQ